MFTSPICVDQNSKTTLQAAIWNDSLFLSSLGVMDYSLLVGIDSNTKQFTVGIIGKLPLFKMTPSDYIRKYTWDKQLETLLKSSGIVGGRGKIPTIISPKQYKVRFREAMNFYFVRVPNKNTSFRVKRWNAAIKSNNLLQVLMSLLNVREYLNLLLYRACLGNTCIKSMFIGCTLLKKDSSIWFSNRLVLINTVQ